MIIAVKKYILLRIILIFIVCYWSVEGSFTGLRIKKQADSLKQPKRIICQYAYWAAKRPGEFKFTPKDIDAKLCTHIVYDYARLEPSQGIIAYDPKEDIANRGWESIIELKSINPEAKILLSVGGLFEGSSRFTKMATDAKLRATFVQSALNLIKEYNFDGLDITWLYPGFSLGSSNADKANYVSLVKDLRDEFKDNFLLTVSAPALKQHIESGFDIPELVKYVDYISVLAYSYHDSPDATVNHHGPLYSLPNDPDNQDANVDSTIREYIKRGAHPSSLNLVIPLYGVAFKLEDPEKTDIGSSTEDEGEGLEEPGALIYFELCQRIINESWTVKRVNSTAMGPYAFKDKLWVAYDDQDMVRNKAKYANQMGLGGLSFWTVDQDDFRAVCHSENFPLLKAGREAFLNPSNSSESVNQSEEVTTSTNSVKSKVTDMITDVNVELTTYRPPFRTRKPSTSTTTSKTSVRTSLETNKFIKQNPNTKSNRKIQNFLTSSEGDLYIKPGQLNDGPSVYRSNRDIVFSNLNILIDNYFNVE